MTDLQILIAITDDTGRPTLQDGPDATPAPVLREAPPSPLLDRIREVTRTTFAAQALRLDRFARRLARPDLADQPVCLYLSDEEGGYARHGFWLQQENGERQYRAVPYINMVVGETELERGFYETTFPHELAHTTLRLLVGDITAGPTRKMHQSMAITDYPTALDEGWAEHFEVLIHDSTANPWLRGEKQGRVPDLIATWLSKVDEALRQDGVRRNQFVHARPVPEAALEPTPDPWQVWLEGETGGDFRTDALRTGQAMLSCEGVGATLFYRIVTCEPLRERYLDERFYARFGATAESISPYENVNLKLFAALHELAADGPPDPYRPLLLEMVRSYARLFPEESEPLWRLFLETTWGATASREVAATLQALAYQGRTGNLAGFQFGIDQALQALEQLRADVLSGRVDPGANLGPGLWVLNQSFLIPAGGLWNQAKRSIPLSINLNTAAVHELMSIPGIDLALARQIVQARQQAGFFRSLEDLALPEPLAATLRSMQEAMAQAGTHHRV